MEDNIFRLFFTGHEVSSQVIQQRSGICRGEEPSILFGQIKIEYIRPLELTFIYNVHAKVILPEACITMITIPQ